VTSFSLDTPPPTPDAVYSGYNFREVAPEILSPLTWSIVGAGMEQGFREATRLLGCVCPETRRPHYVAYLGFRPYFVISTIARVTAHLPGVDIDDVWELLLGGPGPLTAASAAGGPPMWNLRRVPGQVRLGLDNQRAFGQTCRLVAEAEDLVLRTLRSRQTWAAGAAFERALAAGRAAWALHIRTTCGALMAASLLRRLLTQRFGDETALDLLRAAAKRGTEGQAASAHSGRLRFATERITTYEVVDRASRFQRFGQPPRPMPSLMNAGSARGEADLDPPTSVVTGPVLRQFVYLLEIALAERERSKELGLRALHCMRNLVECSPPAVGLDDSALLGAHELRDLDERAQRSLIARRAEELEEAAGLEMPVDLRLRDSRIVALGRPRAQRGDSTIGVPLSGGWAEGRLVAEGDGSRGLILAGQRVDGNHVLATRPEGVVAQYGSVLSHVAIVCRELGIPFVSGISVDGQVGRRAVVDGWSGRLTVSD
jgi:rifampicin phosphotransferase